MSQRKVSKPLSERIICMFYASDSDWYVLDNVVMIKDHKGKVRWLPRSEVDGKTI